MTQPIFRVAALCTHDRKLIGTVISYRKSAQYAFRMVDISKGETADIAVLDGHDPLMRAELALAMARNPNLKVLQLILATGTTQTRRHEFELPYVQIVSHLLPLLEQVAAKTSIDPRITHQVTPQAAPPVAAATQAKKPVPSGKVLQLAPEPQRKRLRALVVDDSPTVRMQLVKTVERIGMQCDSADGPREAMTHLNANVYDIIYLDVIMPEMDGYKLTREIKRNATHKATPVIILTSQSSPFDRARGALAGCDTYLTKPVNLNRFFEATAKTLRKHMAVDDLDQWIINPTQASTQAPATSPAPTEAARSAPTSTQPATATWASAGQKTR